MSGSTEAPGRVWPWQRWALRGFVVGSAITVPATFVALLFPVGEALLPYLVPGTALLVPLSGAMAAWPGLVNVAIAFVVNGVVYAAVAGALGVVLITLRKR